MVNPTIKDLDGVLISIDVEAPFENVRASSTSVSPLISGAKAVPNVHV
jgi:hypothetical protein